MPRPSRRYVRRFLTFAIIAVAVVVVVLVILIGLGTLVLPSKSSAPVTISMVHLIVQEGNTSSGVPWLGPWSINYTTAEGYPLQVSPGGTWSVAWTFFNFDYLAHTIKRATPSPPFTIASYVPGVPYTVNGGEDGGLSMVISAPSNPGSTYAVTLIVDVGLVS